MAAQVQHVNALLGRRQLTVIPKDQLALLDRIDSWAVDQVNKPHGLANVPGHVLKTTKDAYIARLRLQANGSAGSINVNSGVRPQNGAVGSPSASSESPPPSPRDTEMSWSESPPERRLRPRRNEESPAFSKGLNEATRASPSRSSQATLHQASPRQSPRRRQPMESPTSRKAPMNASQALSSMINLSPRRSTPSRMALAQRQDGNHSPIPKTSKPAKMAPPPRPSPPRQQAPAFELYSSDIEEEASEVSQSQPVPDGAVVRNVALLQGSSGSTAMSQEQANFTPPCAQISQSVVPETVVKTNSPVKEAADPEPRRRQRIMKPHNFSDDSPVVVRPRNVLEPGKIYEKPESSNAVSSSIIPSTQPEVATQVSSGSSHHETIGAREGQQTEDRPMVETGSPSTTPKASDENFNPNILPENISSANIREQERQISLQNASTVGDHEATATADILAREFPDPFHTFALLYPAYTSTYSGSLSRFVRACVCLEYLRQERALKDFLYDDFIRSFSAGFLSYVVNAGPGQEPLPAVEWYNMQPGRPVFTSMVVHKKNLDVILKAYPDEVAQARAVITANTQPTEEVIRPAATGHGRDGSMDVDEASPQQPRREPTHVGNHGPAENSPALSTAASPEQNGVPSAPPRDLATPASGTRRRGASRYFERLASSSRPGSKRKAEDHSERLRRHLKQRISSGATSFASSGSRMDSTPNS